MTLFTIADREDVRPFSFFVDFRIVRFCVAQF